MYKEKLCEICGNKFIPTSGNQKYCENCKKKVKLDKEKIRWRNRNRKINNYKEFIRVCPICGVTFTTHYKRKIYCGSDFCEKERIKIKNKRIHINRDKKYLIKKGRDYYNNNRELCCLNKANKYREKNNSVKEYVGGRIYKHSIDYVRSYVEKFGYKLISDNYINNRTNIKLICPNGHYWETNFHNFKDGKARCFTCYIKNNYTSKFELEVRDFVTAFYYAKIIYNDRTKVFNKNTNKFLELDLYFPELNKAIECDGVYWHSSNSAIIRDEFKNEFCLANNIDLLRVNDKEWFFGDGKIKVKEFITIN